MIITAEGKKQEELRELLVATKIVESYGVDNVEKLLEPKPTAVPFKRKGITCFQEGSYVVLDFGKELCGGIRMITRESDGMAKWRFTFGESLTEAYSTMGEKNAMNYHSPRDFEVVVPMMSDLQYGQTGFRFVKMELLEGAPATIYNIFAVSQLPLLEKEAEIVTNDAKLNEIIRTAAYTLKLNLQHGFIWDGIKRDRLVWCGDLHPEIMSSLYMFGNVEHITNSLEFLRDSKDPEQWVNTIPSYSAWWVINMCDYCTTSGDWEFFDKSRAFALEIMERFDQSIRDTGELELTDGEGMEYFLDWSTFETEDAKVGVKALILWMAQKYVAIEENARCRSIVDKLSRCIDEETTTKPVRAFQILVGRQNEEDADMLQKNGANGFSTFMAYYILTAMAKAGGNDMLDILKTYYGGMLSRGATTFWEDFDINWLENSCRVDEIPTEQQKDIHGDFGKYCYTQFRHSLCHGWSAGVLAFIVEYVLGVKIKDGGETFSIEPHTMGLTNITAKIPVKQGWLSVEIVDGQVNTCMIVGEKGEVK